MGLVSKVNFGLTTVLSSTAVPINDTRSIAAMSYLRELSNGAGLAAANVVYATTLTIGASATTTLDVATGGGLVDGLGTAVAMARVKGMWVRAAAGNVNNVVVTRPATNGVPIFGAASGSFPVKPDGLFAFVDLSAAGIVVTAATGDLIDFVNSGSGSTVSADVVIIGAAT
jgi:hypothetical protein